MSSGPDGPAEPSIGLSVVIPVRDEVDSLPELWTELHTVLEGRDSVEVLFVDDGSGDGSSAAVDRMAELDPRIRPLHLRRNFGKAAALAAGFDRARGRVVVTLDADLQDDPALIPGFLRRIEDGADLVVGWKKRRHDPLGKRLSSWWFNAAVRMASGMRLHDVNCGFKAYTAECIHELRLYGGLHRLLPMLAHARGFKVEELVVEHRPRRHGRSKYGASRAIDGFLDLLTALLVTRFRLRPLHFFGVVGLPMLGIGLAILIYLSVLWFGGAPIGTRPLLLLGVLLTLTAALLLGLGLLGELLVRTTVTAAEVYSIATRRARARPAPSGEPARIEAGPPP